MTIYVNGHGWINAVSYDYKPSNGKVRGVKKIHFTQSRALAGNMPESYTKEHEYICRFIEQEYKCNYDCHKF